MLVEDMGQAYKEAGFLLKRNYLGIFFKRFIVKKGKVIEYDLTEELKPLIKNESVRVKQLGSLVRSLPEH